MRSRLFTRNGTLKSEEVPRDAVIKTFLKNPGLTADKVDQLFQRATGFMNNRFPQFSAFKRKLADDDLSYVYSRSSKADKPTIEYPSEYPKTFPLMHQMGHAVVGQRLLRRFGYQPSFSSINFSNFKQRLARLGSTYQNQVLASKIARKAHKRFFGQDIDRASRALQQYGLDSYRIRLLNEFVEVSKKFDNQPIYGFLHSMHNRKTDWDYILDYIIKNK